MMGVAKYIVARASNRNIGKFYQTVKLSAENLRLFHADSNWEQCHFSHLWTRSSLIHTTNKNYNYQYVPNFNINIMTILKTQWIFHH